MPESHLAQDVPILSAWRDIGRRIAEAATGAGRRPEDVALIAVSKGHPPDAILPLLEAGQRQFGESRVQEARAKWPVLKARFPDVELHLVGPLQANKLREALELFDVIQTLDRPKLADRLTIAKQGTRLFIQVNTGEEPQKSGIAPERTGQFVRECRALGLHPEGLMCIPPLHEPAALHFALLAKLARREGLPLLSMGMSDDFETAIAFGATHVRVGTALFGARPQPAVNQTE